MRKALQIVFKKSALGWCTRSTVNHVVKVHHLQQKNGYFQKYSTRASNVNHVPHDLLFGERKEMFIKQLQKRLSRNPQTPNKRASPAAILVPFCMFDNKPSILFTKRSHKLVRNKGDVSFPGGKQDDGDKDVIDTALRETEEEIGIARSNIEIWTTTKPILTVDGTLRVIPVIGFVNNLDISSLILDHNEVVSAFAVPIQDFCKPANQRYTKFRNGHVLPLFFKDTYYIWGFTANIVDHVLAILLPDIYTSIHHVLRKTWK